MTKDEAQNLANHWVAAWNTHDLDAIMTTTTKPSNSPRQSPPNCWARQMAKSSESRVSEPTSSADSRLPQTPLPPRKRALGPQQRRALLHQSKRNPHGRVHGALSGRKSPTSRRKLHRLASHIASSSSSILVALAGANLPQALALACQQFFNRDARFTDGL